MRQATGERIVFLAVAALTLACASQPKGPTPADLKLTGWSELRAKRFTLSGNVPPSELRRVAEDLAYYLAVVDRLSSTTTARVPARFYILKGNTWKIFQPPGVGGYILPQLDGYYSALGADEPDPITRWVLLHEYTHFLIRKGRALRYPSWYDEGFAELLGSTRRRRDLLTIGSPAPGRLQELWYLDEIDVGPVMAADRETMQKIPGFYAISWALTHYLLMTPSGMSSLQEMVAGQASGLAFEDAYARAFDVSIETLSAEVTQHVERLQRGMLPLIEVETAKLSPDLAWQVETVGPAQAACELGEFALLLHDSAQDHVDEYLAWKLFEQALTLDPSHSRARAGLAVGMARSGHFDEAETELARTMTEAPEQARVHRSAGEVHLRRALAAKQAGDRALEASSRSTAKQAYRRALELDPDDLGSLAGLGRAYLEESDPGPGIAALERARQRGAWDARVAMDLGRLYMAAGKTEPAKRLWLEVIRIGDVENVAEARALLEEAGGPQPAP